MAKHNFYPTELKIQIVERLLDGESPTALRKEFHIPSKGTLYNWKKWYLTGEINRLSLSSGRLSKQAVTLEQKLENTQKELELLKKFFRKERTVTTESIIHFINKQVGILPITKMTQLFGLSRSTYYRNRERNFAKLTSIEEQIYQLSKENYFLFGYRKIHALLSRKIAIGINTVARIMRKRGWNCLAKVKKHRHVGEKHQTFDNHIQKNWSAAQPLKKLTTDITYLLFGKSMMYLSTIMDTFNSEIVAYKLSHHPDTKLVVDTLNQLGTLSSQTILHSDQGATYTSKEFCELVKQKNVIQSMSRKGTPSDNAPIESFHSSLKSETFYINTEPISSNTRVIDIVENYIYFWNNQRILAKLDYLSPVDYRIKTTK
ncbi:IS3 family transposase [Enterococcus sp. MJM12]|uniref:IS3 family transposase n=1 Tax=Candidatus Enterococcus myersii TaxID=2815322 RepID=A0ABS3H9K1_9ENTE|nr:IS3 family transposase [Enterococcus sp. MJM12]MBO0449717.1 IS3 family transposase [Enterococcus sp. MJM12]